MLNCLKCLDTGYTESFSLSWTDSQMSEFACHDCDMNDTPDDMAHDQTYDHDAFVRMVESGTKAWADVPWCQ